MYSIIISMVMIMVGILAVPQPLDAEDNLEGTYYTHFDEYKIIDNPPESTGWCEPAKADMLFKTFQSEATIIGGTHTEQEGEIIACQVHLSGVAYGFYNFIDIAYRWDNGQEKNTITMPHKQLYAKTITFIQKGPSSFQEITITVRSGGFCSAEVAADVEWFYTGDENPIELTTPPYYFNFDDSQSKSNEHGDAFINEELADIALFTDEPDGTAYAKGITKTWYDNSNCKCPYIGVKVHIMGRVKGRGIANLDTIYTWNDHEVKKEWTFSGGPGEGNFIDETWVYIDHYYLSDQQTFSADLSAGSSIEADLFIDVEWFYEGCGPPYLPE